MVRNYMARPFFVASARIVTGIAYYLIIVPALLAFGAVPIWALLTYPAAWVGQANLGALLAFVYLAFVVERRIRR